MIRIFSLNFAGQTLALLVVGTLCAVRAAEPQRAGAGSPSGDGHDGGVAVPRDGGDRGDKWGIGLVILTTDFC